MAQTESTFPPAVKERRWGSVLSSYSLISYITLIQMLCVTPTWLHLFALPPSPLVLSIRIKITFNYPVAYMFAVLDSMQILKRGRWWSSYMRCQIHMSVSFCIDFECFQQEAYDINDDQNGKGVRVVIKSTHSHPQAADAFLTLSLALKASVYFSFYILSDQTIHFIVFFLFLFLLVHKRTLFILSVLTIY